MKSFLAFLLVVATATLCFSQSMTVHTTTGPTSFNLADIDSITFSVSSIPTDSLIAYYPFNGDANDESGNGFNANTYNVALTTDRFGNANSAYLFDANNDSIVVANTNILNGYSNATVTGWMYYQGGGQNPRFFSKRPHLLEMWLNKSAGNNKIGIHYNNIQYLSDSSAVTNVWTFLCVVKESNELRIYKNGVLTKTSTVSGDLPSNSYRLMFGQQQAGGNLDWLSGKLDDILIYNRALSASEIQALYHVGGW